MRESVEKPVDQQESVYRYERKFAISPMDVDVFRHQLKLSQAGFRQAYAPRHVNNLYFDTIDYASLFDNVEGVGHRAKMRVRWYGSLQGEIPAPFLEYKVKQGTVGTKRRYDLAPFPLTNLSQITDIVAVAADKSSLPPAVRMDLQRVRPTLLNRYRREYYQTSDGFRVTIDTHLDNYSPTRGRRSLERLAIAVVELKYDTDLELQADQIVDDWGLRVMKNSKYVAGLMAVSH